MGVLTILDEPSIGLHQRVNNRLIETLKQLRDRSNTVLVVRQFHRAAVHVVDMGPGGELGGKVVAGTPERYRKSIYHRCLPGKSNQTAGKAS